MSGARWFETGRKPMTLRRRASAVGMIAVASAGLLAAQPEEGALLVAVKGEAALAVVRGDRVVRRVTESGFTGHEVAASPDGRFAFVPIYGNSGVGKPGTDGASIDVIDIAAGTVVGKIAFPHGVRPHCPVFGPKDGRLYVTTELDRAVTVIDPATRRIVASIPTGQAESHMLAVSHDGRRGYTANVGPGTVSVLDLVGRKTLAVIPVAKTTQRIAISMDDRWVFTSDQEAPRLAVIDTAADRVARWIALPAVGYGTAPTPDGRWLLVAMPEANAVAVVDLGKMQVVRTLPVPAAPQEVLVRPDGAVAYVSCEAAGQVAEIDLASWRVSRRIDTGKATDGLAWAR